MMKNGMAWATLVAHAIITLALVTTLVAGDYPAYWAVMWVWAPTPFAAFLAVMHLSPRMTAAEAARLARLARQG